MIGKSITLLFVTYKLSAIFEIQSLYTNRNKFFFYRADLPLPETSPTSAPVERKKYMVFP